MWGGGREAAKGVLLLTWEEIGGADLDEGREVRICS